MRWINSIWRAGRGKFLLRRRQRPDLHQHVFLAHHQVGGVQSSQLKPMAVGDGVCGTGFNAVAAEDAAIVVDVVNLGVALGRGDANLLGIFSSFNEDAIRGAGRRAQETGYALFQAVLIALQHVRAAIALLEDRAAFRAFSIGIVLHLCGLKDLPEGDAHPLGNGRDVAHDGHEVSIRRIPGSLDDAFSSLAAVRPFALRTKAITAQA
jgi:hypothetical protein